MRTSSQRIAGNDDDVGKLPWLDSPDLLLHTEAFGSHPGGRADRLKRGEATFDQFLQLAGTFAVSDNESRVRTCGNLDPSRLGSP